MKAALSLLFVIACGVFLYLLAGSLAVNFFLVMPARIIGVDIPIGIQQGLVVLAMGYFYFRWRDK